MNYKFKVASHSEQDGSMHSSYTNFPQPWWPGFRHDAIPSETTGERTNPIPQDLLGGGFRSVTDVPTRGPDNVDVSKEMQVTTVSLSDGKSGQEQQYPEHASSVMPHLVGEFVSPPTQMELVGHSVACAPYTYSDPYYAGLITAQSPDSLGHFHFHGPQLTRMALPLEMAEEPVYVNAKQYHGILRRRQIRAKAELERKVVKARKPYLHESRHRHAMRRARGSGGRFLNTKKLENAGANNTSDKGTSGSTVTVESSSCAHLGSKFVPSNCSGSTNPSTLQQDAYRTTMRNMLQTPSYLVDNGHQNNLQHHGFKASTYGSFSDDRGGGESSGQEHEKVMINRSLHRAMTIK